MQRARRIFYEKFEDVILRERETIAVCLRNFKPWPRGPQLDLPTALKDVAEVNKLLADVNLMPCTPRRGWRYKCSLVYKSGVAGQRAFFRALRVGPRLAGLVGTVVVDVEEILVVKKKKKRAGDTAVADDDEGDDRRETGGTAAADPGGRRVDDDDEAGQAAEVEKEEEEGEGYMREQSEDAEEGLRTERGSRPPEAAAGSNENDDDEEDNDEDEEDDDAFEHVAVCRRMTLAQFYTMLRPSLHQIAVDFQGAGGGIGGGPPPLPSEGGIGPSASTSSRRGPGGLIDEDDGLCSICMDGALEVVTRCTHAFCEECYLRWLALSRECPLCRERLGLELTGSNDGSYALVSWGQSPSSTGDGDGDVRDGDGAGGGHRQGQLGLEGQRVDAAWLRGRLRALPAVAEPGRRAHEMWLLRRMRERELAAAAAAAT